MPALESTLARLERDAPTPRPSRSRGGAAAPAARAGCSARTAPNRWAPRSSCSARAPADPTAWAGVIARDMSRSYGDAAQLERDLALELTGLGGFELDPVTEPSPRAPTSPSASCPNRWCRTGGWSRSFPARSTCRSVARPRSTSTAGPRRRRHVRQPRLLARAAHLRAARWSSSVREQAMGCSSPRSAEWG